MIRRFSVVLAVFLGVPAHAQDELAPTWADVSPIFTKRCVMCHSKIAGASKGLRLDSYAAAMIGSERGAVLIPGNAMESELIRRLRGESQPRMPFLGRPLPEGEIKLIEAWITVGLPNESKMR